MNDRLLKALAGSNHSSVPPVWLMRQAGRYMASYRKVRAQHSFMEIVKTPELVAKVTLLPIQQFDFDAAIIFSDILVLLEPFGIQVAFNEGPQIQYGERILEGECNSLENQLQPLYEAVSLTKSLLGVPLLGFAGAPFTLMNYALDHDRVERSLCVKTLLYQDRTKFLRIYQKIEEAVIRHLQLQIEAGCDAVQLFDTWAGNLTASDFREIIVPSIKRITQQLSKPLIYFGRGVSHHAREIAATGVAALGCDWGRSLKDIRQDIGQKTILQGNIDPIILFSTKEAIRQAVQQVKLETANDPAFIFNLGHGVLPGTPEENVAYLVEQVRIS